MLGSTVRDRVPGQTAVAHALSTHRQIVHALLSIASATLLIRIFGMAMQIVVTARFGLGPSMDAYFIAAGVPVLLAGALVSPLQSAIVPVFVRARSAGNTDEAARLFSTVLNLAILAALAGAGLMLLFRHQILFISAPGAGPVRQSLASELAPFIFPTVILTVALGVLEAVLNAEGQFGWPAYAGALVPLTSIVAVLAGGRSLGIVTLAIGSLAGLSLQLGAYIVRIRRARIAYRPILDWHNPFLAAVGSALMPLLASSCIIPISPVIDQIFASGLSVGSISALNYALKLLGVPTGVVFAAVSRATLPFLSRHAADDDKTAFKSTLRLYLWATAIGTALLAIPLFLLAHPVIAILFQRGAFTAADVDRTAYTFTGFAIGVVPMSVGFLLAASVSALRKNRFLLYTDIFTLGANALLDYIFARLWQSFGIALATSLVYVCTMVILVVLLRREIGPLNLFTLPPELKDLSRLIQSRAPGFPEVREQIGRAVVYVMAIAGSAIGGTYIARHNLTTSIKLLIGLPIIAVWLCYPYVLLLSWALIDPFIGSKAPFFNGNNFDTALTIPTLLLLFTIPVHRTFRRIPALALFGAFLIWVLLGINISPLDHTAFMKLWLIFVDYAAVALIASRVVSTESRLNGLIDALLVAPALIALYGIYGYATHQNVIVTDTGIPRITSIMSDAPTLALLVSNVVPLALYRVFTTREPRRALALFIAADLLAATALTFSRGAIISVTICIVVMTLLLPSVRMRLGMLAMIGIGLVAVLFSNVHLLERFAGTDTSSLNGRTYLWSALLNNFDPTHLLGYGLNASATYLAGLQIGQNGELGNGLIATSASNLYVATLYDQGIIGLVLLVAALFALGVGLLRGMLRSNGRHRLLFLVSLLTLINVLIQSIDVNDILSQFVGIAFWLIVTLPFAACWAAPGRWDSSGAEPAWDADP